MSENYAHYYDKAFDWLNLKVAICGNKIEQKIRLFSQVTVGMAFLFHKTRVATEEWILSVAIFFGTPYWLLCFVFHFSLFRGRKPRESQFVNFLRRCSGHTFSLCERKCNERRGKVVHTVAMQWGPCKSAYDNKQRIFFFPETNNHYGSMSTVEQMISTCRTSVVEQVRNKQPLRNER